MTLEDRIKLTMGEQQFQLASLLTQLEEAKNKIAELEKKNVVDMKQRKRQDQASGTSEA